MVTYFENCFSYANYIHVIFNKNTVYKNTRLEKLTFKEQQGLKFVILTTFLARLSNWSFFGAGYCAIVGYLYDATGLFYRYAYMINRAIIISLPLSYFVRAVRHFRVTNIEGFHSLYPPPTLAGG